MDTVRVQDGHDDDDGTTDDIDLSALNDNETDDFGRKILAAQKQKRDMQNAGNGRGLFPRARPRPRPARPKTTDLVTTREGETPALNVPQEWGRRAKKREREWQRRSVSDEHRHVRQDKDSIFPHQTLYTGDEHPVLSPGGGGVLPSVEDTPPSMARKRIMSSPNSMRHMNTTIQATRSHGEDLEFNDESMLVSTPAAVNRRDRKIDELMKGDDETVERRRIERRRMTEILKRPGSAPGSDLASRVARRRERRLSDEENVPEAPNAGVIATDDEVASRRVQKPSHSRNDSIALLRKLSRSLSMSPSPVQKREEANDVVKITAAPISNVAEALRKSNSTNTRIGTSRTEARRVRIHDEKARREEAAEIDEVQPHKTPVVTGAWVDTPGKPQQAVEENAQPARVSALRSSSAPSRDPRRVLSEPTHPKSALEAIVSDARTNRDPQLGESTIASLENIVNPDLERTNSNIEDLARGEIPTDAESLKHLTQSEKDRRQEELALEALHKQLRNTRSTIKDASRGITRIGNQIEQLPGQQHSTTEQHPAINEGTHDINNHEVPPWPSHLRPYTQPHNSRTICQHCGGGYTSVYSALWNETVEFFFTRTGPEQNKLRPTPLTWAVLAFILWYWIESSLSDPWGYSRIAEAYFPFALPALLLKPFRWLGWMEYPVGRAVGEFLEPAITLIFGNVKPLPINLAEGVDPGALAGSGGRRVVESLVANGTPYSEWIKATTTAVASATTMIGKAAGRWREDEFLDL